MNILLDNPGFSFFGLTIHWYGVIMATSMLVAIILTCVNAKKRGAKTDDIITLALIVLPLAVIGARLYYCLFYADHAYSFVEFWQIWNGGNAIYGGIIGGALGVLLFCLIKKRNFLDFADIIVPGLILAQAIGRWGNFVNQEAYGYEITNTAWQFFPAGVQIDGVWHMATFFYESAWNLIGFAILMAILYKVKDRGIPTASYLLFYGIGRAVIEGLRTDSLYWGSIRVSQLLSIVLAVASLVWIVVYYIIKHKKANKQVNNLSNGKGVK